MIQHPAFLVEPWALHETELHLDSLAQTESLFALSNGHIGLRGNLDEGEPHGLPGTYLNGFYEVHPMPYAEAGYGFPKSAQTLINVTNGKLLRLVIDGEPFDVRHGKLRSHTRVLDFRAGTLTRTAEWTSPAGRTVRVNSVRLVSFTQCAVVAISYQVEPIDCQIHAVLHSELVANEALPIRSDDPRASWVLETPLECENCSRVDTAAVLVHRTKQSGLRVAAAMEHVFSGSPHIHIASQSLTNLARVSIADVIQPGQRFCLTKFVAYGWSFNHTMLALRDQVMGALEATHLTTWEGLLGDQRQYLDAFWTQADVEVEGDAELQQAVRFALFHVLQAGARAERRAIPAKGLTGPGYDGHSFWVTAHPPGPIACGVRQFEGVDAGDLREVEPQCI
jgi:alpha,alpha-trehalose phosphorylase